MKAGRFTQKSDLELLDLFYQTGDSEWLGILLERFTLLLYGVCVKYLKNEEEARDAVQQIFLKVLTEVPRYKVTYFRSWLYTLTRNHCLMCLRNRKSSALEITDLTEPRQEDDLEENRLNAILREARLNKIDQALDKLPVAQQRCIRLFYLSKKTYQQIAEETGWNYMQVKSHIQNGKRNLRMFMKSSGEVDYE